MKRMILKLLVELPFSRMGYALPFLLLPILVALLALAFNFPYLLSLLGIEILAIYFFGLSKWTRFLKIIAMKTDIGMLYVIRDSKSNQIVDTAMDHPFFEWIRNNSKLSHQMISWRSIKDSYKLSFSFRTLREGEEIEVSVTTRMVRDRDFEASLNLAERFPHECSLRSELRKELKKELIKKFEKAYPETPKDLSFRLEELEDDDLNIDNLPFSIDLSSVEFNTESVVLYPVKKN